MKLRRERERTGDRGARFEALALAYLRRRGLTLVERNYRWRGGELDLIMRDAGLWVFVEVRYRAPGTLVSATESIGPVKQQRIMRTAQSFLMDRLGTCEVPMRFDVVAIDGDHVRWIVHAFES